MQLWLLIVIKQVDINIVVKIVDFTDLIQKYS